MASIGTQCSRRPRQSAGRVVKCVCMHHGDPKLLFMDLSEIYQCCALPSCSRTYINTQVDKLTVRGDFRGHRERLLCR